MAHSLTHHLISCAHFPLCVQVQLLPLRLLLLLMMMIALLSNPVGREH